MYYLQSNLFLFRRDTLLAPSNAVIIGKSIQPQYLFL